MCTLGFSNQPKTLFPLTPVFRAATIDVFDFLLCHDNLLSSF
uniref:Uncharacterized protein n=1 Tax=Rhizobium rhizogenes TaxID=359 RepID=A0A4P8DKK5_RHIRH|nr:hypothetical protein pTiC5.7_102 [Rhizobium rhizogenes]QCL10944.1 hypothetical protein pTiC6.5_102 [Rhizobium rhizogenes]